MRQHSSTLERKWNRQFTRPIFPAGTKNPVWERDYTSKCGLGTRLCFKMRSGNETTLQNVVLEWDYASKCSLGTRLHFKMQSGNETMLQNAVWERDYTSTYINFIILWSPANAHPVASKRYCVTLTILDSWMAINNVRLLCCEANKPNSFN